MKTLHLVLAIILGSGFVAGCGRQSGNFYGEQSKVGDPRMRLFWQTESEDQSQAFYVYRSEGPDEPAVLLNAAFPVPAAGVSSTPNRYYYHDLDVEEGATYWYTIQLVEDGDVKKWIIDESDNLHGQPKPLTQEELETIRTHGVGFRQDVH